MSNIDQLIEDFTQGKIGLYFLQEELEGQFQGDILNQDNNDRKVSERLLSQGITEKDPLDILIEKERFEQIVGILQRVKEALPNELWYILVQYVVYKRTQEDIRKELGVNQSTILRRLKKIASIASRIVSRKEYEECFVHNSMFEADTPQVKLKYPADAAVNDTHGKYSACGMHRYLDNAFGDCKTICNGYCGKQCNNPFIKSRLEKC